MRYLYVVLCLLLILGCKTYTAKIEWKHTTPDLAYGFKLYCGKFPGIYNYIIDLGSINPVSYEGTIGKYTYSQVITERRYKEIRYCAMSSYSKTGSEGPLSLEVPVVTQGNILKINFTPEKR